MTKKVLITGKNSFIGHSFIEYCKKNLVDFTIDEVETRERKWEKIDFSPYDSVFHVAGIAHNSSNKKLKDMYYKINTDLTIDIAKKAKKDGVKQFIFMSSMIVFGNKKNGKTKITSTTKPNPDSFYGDSKLQAEIGLLKLESKDFKVVILRPPIIYGRGSKGNYPLLSKLAQKTPIFPEYSNIRSMLYIDNLTEFIKLMIIYEETGIYHPQNKALVKTTDMVKIISEYHGNRIWFVNFMDPIINFSLRINLIKKVFGDFFYENKMSEYDKADYQIVNFKDSIAYTEG